MSGRAAKKGHQTMTGRTLRVGGAAALAGLALAVAATAVGAQSVGLAGAVGTGAFRNTAAIETQLRRGVSTRADVQRVVGIPNGSGAAAFPGYTDTRWDVWYYEDIEVTDAKGREDALVMSMRQQILLVFFKGEVFDGYLWTSNAGTAEAK